MRSMFCKVKQAKKQVMDFGAFKGWKTAKKMLQSYAKWKKLKNMDLTPLELKNVKTKTRAESFAKWNKLKNIDFAAFRAEERQKKCFNLLQSAKS